MAGGAVVLRWTASPTAALRAVAYAVLRRASGSGTFAEIGRTGPLGEVDVMYEDVPPSGSYDYAVRTVVSTFTSADTPAVTVTTTP